MHDNAEGCMNCGQIVGPYEITKIIDLNAWYARYRCPDDNRTWKIKLLEWTPTLRAAWYRNNVLTPVGLASPPSPMPWDTPEGSLGSGDATGSPE